MDKYLIINADDFGMCHAHNVATFDLLKKGAITSSTIMAPCPWAYEAVKFAKENPQFAIGHGRAVAHGRRGLHAPWLQ